jgi:diguanylate cyclase (GGDEF)-like protein/PAS domain S-box-containing protein
VNQGGAHIGEATLSESEDRYRRLVEMSPDSIFVIQDGYHVFANRRGLRLLGGQAVEDLQCQPAIEFMDTSVRPDAQARMRAVHDDGEALDYVEERIVTLQGQVLDIEAAACPITYQGRPAMLVVVRDITARKASEVALARAEERFHSAFRHAPIGMAILDVAGFVVAANPALAAILEYDASELVGRALVSLVHPEDRAATDAAFRRLVTGGSAGESTEIRCRRSDGETVWVRTSVSAGWESGGADRTFVIQLQDVTAARTAEAKLTHQAMHDPLTDLPNRQLFMDRLAQAGRRAGRDRHAIAVLFCDLDRFKVVNDSLGHTVGDLLLKEVAKRLRRALRPADTVARLGGDEFAVLIEDAAGEDEARIVARRLTEAVAQPMKLAGAEVFVTASIGVTVGYGQQNAEAMLRDADSAMYRAKQRGKSRFEVFDERMRVDALHRLEMENALHRAIERDELRLHYQPIASLADGRVASVEALLRWQRDGITTMPDDFIPVAEESGLIVPIGDWVLRTAVAQARLWRAAAPDAPPFTMVVNISPRQIAYGGLVALVENELPDAPDRLCLEVTESAVSDASDEVLRTLTAVRDLGVTVAVDDFGTGYSSLTRLRTLPVDIIKIDRSFVAGMGSSPEDESLVLAVITMAHALGLVTVAEGVETRRQAELLLDAGCALGQGEHFGMAAHPTEILARLAPGAPQAGTGGRGASRAG